MPTVGILLNVTPDHLDRHGTMEHYAAIKERLVAESSRAARPSSASTTTMPRAIADRIERAGKDVVRVSVAAPLRDGILRRWQPHHARRRRQGRRPWRARGHRLAARRAQCAERRLRHRRLRRARPRSDRRSRTASPASPALRTAWSRSAARAMCCSSTIPRRPTPMPRPRRWRASTTSSGSPAASRRPAASQLCANSSRASARPI